MSHPRKTGPAVRRKSRIKSNLQQSKFNQTSNNPNVDFWQHDHIARKHGMSSPYAKLVCELLEIGVTK